MPASRCHALGFLLTLVVVVGACELVEWPFLRHPLEDKMSADPASRSVVASAPGSACACSARSACTTNSMTIGPAPDGGPTLVDESGQPRDFLHSDNVKLALSYGALYDQWKGTGKPLRIKLLDVDRLELNLKRNADGHANWQFGAAQPATAASSPQLPQFERLNVRNGEVRLEDVPSQIVADAHVTTHEGSARAAAGASACCASALDVASASSIAASAPKPLSPASTPPAGLRIALAPIAASVASGATSASAALDEPVPADDGTPGLRVDATGSYRKAPLVLALRSSGLLPLAASDADSPAVPLWIDLRAGRTHIRLDGSASDLLHFGGMDASFDASGPSLAAVGDALGITLPTTAEFKTSGRLRKQGALWDAGVAVAGHRHEPPERPVHLRQHARRAQADRHAGGARLALPDLGPAFGAPAPDAHGVVGQGRAQQRDQAGARASAPAVATSGKVLPERQFDIPSLKAMNAEVGVQLAVLDLGTDKLEPFTPLQGKITLQDGVLSLHDLLAKTSLGAVQGAIGLDSRPALPKWNADLRWSGIQLARFVKARDIDGQEERPTARRPTPATSAARSAATRS